MALLDYEDATRTDDSTLDELLSLDQNQRVSASVGNDALFSALKLVGLSDDHSRLLVGMMDAVVDTGLPKDIALEIVVDRGVDKTVAGSMLNLAVKIAAERKKSSDEVAA